jgi:hypothetical protein
MIPTTPIGWYCSFYVQDVQSAWLNRAIDEIILLQNHICQSFPNFSILLAMISFFVWKLTFKASFILRNFQTAYNFTALWRWHRFKSLNASVVVCIYFSISSGCCFTEVSWPFTGEWLSRISPFENDLFLLTFLRLWLLRPIEPSFFHSELICYCYHCNF